MPPAVRDMHGPHRGRAILTDAQISTDAESSSTARRDVAIAAFRAPQCGGRPMSAEVNMRERFSSRAA
jgi:hypothetical protein